MTYVVAGVSGNTGRVVAEQLLDAKQKVRVLVRDAKKGEEWKARGAEVAIGDLSDANAVAKALEGAKGAWLLVPPNPAADDFRAYQRGVVKGLVEGVKASKIPHVVLLSSIGAQHAAGTGPIVALHEAEEAFKQLTDTKFTFLRAGYFMENLAGNFGMLDKNIVGSFAPRSAPIEMIATADIGRVAAGALLEGPSSAGTIELGGPSRNMQDVAAILSKILGRTITVGEAPLEAMVPTLTSFGFKPALAELYREMTEGMGKGHVVFEGGHKRIAGSTSLETFLPKFLASMSKGH